MDAGDEEACAFAGMAFWDGIVQAGGDPGSKRFLLAWPWLIARKLAPLISKLVQVSQRSFPSSPKPLRANTADNHEIPHRMGFFEYSPYEAWPMYPRTTFFLAMQHDRFNQINTTACPTTQNMIINRA